MESKIVTQNFDPSFCDSTSRKRKSSSNHASQIPYERMGPQSSKFNRPSMHSEMQSLEAAPEHITSQGQEMGALRASSKPVRSMPIQRLNNDSNEKPHLQRVQKEQMRSGDHDHELQGILPAVMCDEAAEFLSPAGMLRQSSLPNSTSDHSKTRACYKETDGSAKGFQLTRSNQLAKSPGTSKFSHEHADFRGLSSYDEQKEKLSLRGQRQQSKAAANQLEYSSADQVSSRQGTYMDGPIDHVPFQTSIQDVENMNRKSISPGIETSVAAEKLWEGVFRLSPSITVSAIAFYKSGEKLHDINWSTLVEVKGRAHRDEFEDYIQDFPRCHNRGLMVISLCWKHGSSATVLRGIKEVAEEYTAEARVGIAQFSPNVKVYLCPWTKSIITFLLRHGYLEEEAAEDNSELLIGCVVFKKRRNVMSKVSLVSECKQESGGSTLPSEVSRGQQLESAASSAMGSKAAHHPIATVEPSRSILSNVAKERFSRSGIHDFPKFKDASTEKFSQRVLPKVEVGRGLQSSSSNPVVLGSHTPASPKNAFLRTVKKNHFDDDDDDDEIPEWIPPEFQTPYSTEAEQASLSDPSGSSKSAFKSLPMSSSGHARPSPYPAAHLFGRSSQAFRPYCQPPPNEGIPPPGPSQHGSLPTGTTFAQQPRPPTRAAGRRPVRPANKWVPRGGYRRM